MSSTASVPELALCFAAFQNCFWAEYRFMGHILKRQSRNQLDYHCWCVIFVLVSLANICKATFQRYQKFVTINKFITTFIAQRKYWLKKETYVSYLERKNYLWTSSVDLTSLLLRDILHICRRPIYKIIYIIHYIINFTRENNVIHLSE